RARVPSAGRAPCSKHRAAHALCGRVQPAASRTPCLAFRFPVSLRRPERVSALPTQLHAHSSCRQRDGLCLQLTRRSEEHTSELQSRENLVCRLLLEKKKNNETISNKHGI